jgi:group I intron endonuclease
MNVYGAIYKITNTITNKIYVGQTTKTLKQRWGKHIRSANSKSEKRSYLHNSISKHGKENFKIELIEYCENEIILNEREKYYISKLCSQDPKIGYNILSGGNAGSSPNKEHRDKMRTLAKNYLLTHKHSCLKEMNIEDVKNHILKNPNTTLEELGNVLNLSSRTVWRKLKLEHNTSFNELKIQLVGIKFVRGGDSRFDFSLLKELIIKNPKFTMKQYASIMNLSPVTITKNILRHYNLKLSGLKLFLTK